MDDRKTIVFVGNYKGTSQGFVGSVYSPSGISPTIRARDYKDPILIIGSLKKVNHDTGNKQ